MPEREDDFGLPIKLQEELRALYGPARGMTGRDAEILAAARAAGQDMAPRRRYWRAMGAIGMAAAVALAAGIMWRQYSGPALAYARTGDIRDAFYLARQIKAHPGTGLPNAREGSWDANADGVIDQRDVRLLALAAVKLDDVGVKGVTP